MRSEIIDLILFNITNSFDWRTAIDINKIIWNFFNMLANMQSIADLCKNLYYYADCHRKLFDVNLKILDVLFEI